MKPLLLVLALLLVACNPTPPESYYSRSEWYCISRDAANPCPAPPGR